MEPANEGAPVVAKKKTAADVFREIGRWEGETGGGAGRPVRAAALEPPGSRPEVKYVLDTNAVGRVLDGDERAMGALAAVEPQDVGIPLLALAELRFGVESRLVERRTGSASRSSPSAFPSSR